MASDATSEPQLYVTIEGLRAQIIANATMVSTVPATMHDKDPKAKSGFAPGKNNKDMIFDVIVASQISPRSFRAVLLCGDLMNRNPIAIARASETVGEALNCLLRLTMAEMGRTRLRMMQDAGDRPEGQIDKTFL